ncbi:hypothetical protein N7475_002725 [Penicillium sp. IBT 31633x]|nr:hypothetical protein N7475_002725 [Penicillium sp. IBT 31633x]
MLEIETGVFVPLAMLWLFNEQGSSLKSGDELGPRPLSELGPNMMGIASHAQDKWSHKFMDDFDRICSGHMVQKIMSASYILV